MRKGLPLLGLLGALALAACSMNGASTIDGDASSSDAAIGGSFSSEAAMADSSESSIDAAGSASEAASVASDSGMTSETRVVEMTADNWSFKPAAISAKVGEKLVIRLTGVEGVHSLAIAELGIDVPVDLGQVVDIEIPTDKAGTYTFRCRIPCGPGHKDMIGTLTIA